MKAVSGRNATRPTRMALCASLFAITAGLVTHAHAIDNAGSNPERATESTPGATDGVPKPQPAQRPQPPPVPEIIWRVENPFRLFEDAADTNVHRATYNALSEEERATPILSAERALSARRQNGWAAEVMPRTCWDSARNKYQCNGDKNPYARPDHHVVLASLENVADAAVVTCTWLTAPIGLAKRLRGQAVTQPCSKPARLEIPYPAGAKVEVEVGGRRVASETARVEDIFIVGVGDSFGSGEGNPDVAVRFSPDRTVNYGNGDTAIANKKATATILQNLSGYPARVGSWMRVGDDDFAKHAARWQDRACHRSLYSHQLRAALQLAIEDPHRAVTFAGLACSGAEITFGMFLRYKGNEWVPNPPAYSQLSAVAQVQCGNARTTSHDLPQAYHINGAVPELQGGLVLHKCSRRLARHIDLLFVSIGGNDIGFARLLANAILADTSMLRNLGGWMGQVHGEREAKFALKSLAARYKALNRAFHNILHIPWRESDRIILTGYPSMALLGDGASVCPGGNAGMDVAPEFRLSEQRARVSLHVAELLNKKMSASAKRYRWTFVSEHRKKFIGRGICAGYIDHAFSSADDLRLPRKHNGAWVPYNPAQFRPYASRQRWFRTPNDAFMTGNFHVSQSIMTKVLKLESLRWFQLMLAATYSGAFHPSAEGQAAIADAVADQARRVLKKYETKTGAN